MIRLTPDLERYLNTVHRHEHFLAGFGEDRIHPTIEVIAADRRTVSGNSAVGREHPGSSAVVQKISAVR
jgi:hypothetical protein